MSASVVTLKDIQMKMFLLFTHPCVIPNLYDFFSSVEYKRIIL